MIWWLMEATVYGEKAFIIHYRSGDSPRRGEKIAQKYRFAPMKNAKMSILILGITFKLTKGLKL